MSGIEPAGKVVVIGVGNTYRRDDGVGVWAVRQLRGRLLNADVTVLEQSGEGGALLDAWRGAAVVILVDAVASGAPVGTIHRLDATQQTFPLGFFHYSTHAFSLAEAVELARALGELPPRCVVYGIEGGDFAMGEGLSAAVERSARKVLVRIMDELARRDSHYTGG